MGKGSVRHHDLLSLASMKVILFGAGNVATHLGLALQQAGHKVLQVWSRTTDSAEALASSLDSTPHTFSEDPESIKNDIEPTSPLVCIISVKDDAIAEVARRFIPELPQAIWLHTAGSVSIDVLDQRLNPRFGVLYPMQTFSKSKPVDFSRIGIFIEAHGCEVELSELAHSLTQKVYTLDGEGRKRLHLAAVFACNFVNHCYALSESLLADAGIPFEVMLPLIDETAEKVHTLSPRLAQTGPAARHDQLIMERQSNMLAEDPALRDIYERLSQSIIHLGMLR